MFWRKGFMLFFVLSFLLTILNFVARKKMTYSYADLLSYNQLYEVDEQLKISQVTENKDHSVTFAFSGKGVKKHNVFKVYHKDRLLAQVSGPKLTFTPLAGTETYFIKLNEVTEHITIDLNYTPDSVFKNVGNSLSGACELTNVSIPIQERPLYSLKDWGWYFDDFEGEEKAAARYLKDSMKILPTDPSITRVMKIAGYILQTSKGMDGTPTDTMTKLSPIDQLEYARAGKSKIWCGIYTAVFSYFACRAGVPVRFIQCGNSWSAISSGDHVFNEVYIEELGQWLYVDLLAKTIFVKKGERYLNVADVQRLLKYSIDDADLVAGYFNGDSIVLTPYKQVSSTARYYFHPNNTFYFYFGDYLKIHNPRNVFERVKKIFYPKPYYAMYGNNIGSGKSQFDFRIATTYTMVLFMGLCLVFGLVALVIRKKRPK